jgi:molybdenum cofactor guanylyltransferase
MESISGFVLAGGKSSRMGKDKCLLRVGGRTLLESALEKVRAVAERVCIVGSRPDLAHYAAILPDIYADCGPLGGIHAALFGAPGNLNVMLAVDMPLVPAAFLKKMLAAAASSKAVVTYPRTSDGYQPLCAVYRREFFRIAEEALKAGRYKIDPLFSRVTSQAILEDELKDWGFDAAIFTNLNSPQDFDQAFPPAHMGGGR